MGREGHLQEEQALELKQQRWESPRSELGWSPAEPRVLGHIRKREKHSAEGQ